MNKDEKLLEKVYDGDMTILSAMEQQAVAFSLWLHDEGWFYLHHDKMWHNDNNNETKTTAELYQLFNQN